MSKTRILPYVLIIILFITVLVPRLLALNYSVTPDEPRWLTRSANFYQAMSSRNLVHTYQTEHPGVTIMVLGALGFYQYYPGYAQDGPAELGWDQSEIGTWLKEHSEYTPLELLVAGRRWIVLTITLILTLSYLPLRHLLGTWYGFIATLFVVWSPFGIALSRQLHPDGLLSALLCLSLSSFCAWLYGQHRYSFLILSAITMGLAFLTKMPALFLMPSVFLMLCIAWLYSERRTVILSGGILWAMLTLITIFVCWPVLWIKPSVAVNGMIEGMFGHIATDLSDNFFWGEITKSPGPLFYPLAYLWRITPVTCGGLVLTLIGLWKPQDTILQREQVRRLVIAIILFSFIYAVGMSLGAKKSDRYLLPIILTLEIVAAVGWIAFGEILLRRLKIRFFSFTSLYQWKWLPITILLCCLAWPSLSHYPYYFLFHNPIFGGNKSAPHQFVIGWGEGLDQAARWLNQQPHPETMRVVSWYSEGPFSYFFKGTTGKWKRLAPLDWMETDYVIFYVNQWQRNLPTIEMLNYFNQFEPVHTIEERGLELVRIYDMRDTLIPDEVSVNDHRAVDFNHEIRLLTHELLPTEAKPGATTTLKLYLQNLQPMETNYNLLIQLVDQDHQEHWRTEGWPWGAPTREWEERRLRVDVTEFDLPPTLVPGLYRIDVTVYDPATLENLPATDAHTGRLLGEHFHLDYVAIPDGQIDGKQVLSKPIAQVGSAFLLDDIWIDKQSSAPGESPKIHLKWRTIAHPLADYTVFIHMLNQMGQLVAQHDAPPLRNFIPTSLWRPGMALEDIYMLELPTDIAKGTYNITVGLYDSQSGDRLLVKQTGHPDSDVVKGSLLIVK